MAITRGELRGKEAVRSCLMGPGISFGGLAAVSEDEDEDEVHADESTSETPGKEPEKHGVPAPRVKHQDGTERLFNFFRHALGL